MKVPGLLIILLLLCFPATAQKTVSVGGNIVWAGVDRAGDMFVVLDNGGVEKFDKTGKKIGAHKFKAPPTLVDPLDGVQSFYYNRQTRQYGNMSYDFTSVSQFTIDPAFAISPWLVCPALRELWILDSADFSIRKTAQSSTFISLERVLQHLPDKRITDFIHLREYQNYVFVLDKSSGVHMINPLGRFVRTLGEKGMTYFNFLGEELYYLSGNELVLVDLYTQETRRMPLPVEGKFALITDEVFYVASGSKIVISSIR